MKKTAIVVISLFFVLHCFGNGNTPQGTALPLDTAVALALKNNLSIETEQLRLEQQKWEAIGSWNTLLPTATAQFYLSHSNLSDDDRTKQTISGISATGKPLYDETTTPSWSAGVIFSTEFLLNADAVFAIKQAVVAYRSGAVSLAIARETLIYSVKKSYCTLLLNQQSCTLAEEDLAVKEQRFRESSVKFTNGLLSEYAALTSQVDYENAKIALKRAKSTYTASLAEFKQITGIKQEAEILLTDTYESITSQIGNEPAPVVSPRRLDFQLDEWELASSRTARARAIASMTPSFFMKYSANPTFQDDPFTTEWFKSGNPDYTADMWKQSNSSGGAAFSLGISVPLDPLIAFSKAQINIVTLSLKTKEEAVALQDRRETASRKMAAKQSAIADNLDMIEALRLSVTLAEKAVQIAEESYKRGTVPVSDAEDAEVKLNTAKYDLLSEKYRYLVNTLDAGFLQQVGDL